MGAAFLTWEGSDTYSLRVAADAAGNPSLTAAAAAANRGTNTRAVFWRLADTVRRDQQSCVTWDDATSDLHQPGVALRVRHGGGHAQAITVTQNVMFFGRWGFNIHVMDSSQSPAYSRIAGFDLSGVLKPDDRLVPYPWRMCARVVGGTVSFKVWPTSQPEPAWEDAAHGGSVRLPPDWASTSGRAGWYVGHLEPGQSIRFRDLTVASISPTQSLPQPAPRAVPTTLPVEPTTPALEPTDIPTPP